MANSNSNKKKKEYIGGDRTAYPEIKESFRDLLRTIAEIEAGRPEPRYAGEEPATPSDKQAEHLNKIFPYLAGDERLVSALECVLNGTLLFRDQLNGYRLFEGLGLLGWWFNAVPPEWKIDDDIRHRQDVALKLQQALRNL